MKTSDIHQQANTMQYVNQANQRNLPDKNQVSQKVTEKPSSVDKVELSGQAKEMQKIHDALQASPDVRAEKVSTLKKLIQEDQYQVNSDAVAGKMIKESLLDLIK